MNTIYLSLGSNMGDRAQNIHRAVRALEHEYQLVDTSWLYETEPVGYVDQGAFLNAVVKMTTDKSPEEVLVINERIMKHMGRVRTIHQGPRTIDIDILVYVNAAGAIAEVVTNELTLPHPRMHERAFVLEPLCDIDSELMHSTTRQTMGELLQGLGGRTLQKVTQIGSQLIKWGTRPLVMGILNVTPDSFSGDGIITGDEMEEGRVQELVDSRSDIIDVGGMSTRPGHHIVSVEQEIARVLPVIRKLSELRKGVDIDGGNTCVAPNMYCISVDTFRAPVASAAIKAGAQVINSVWGGAYDSQVLNVVAHAQVPIILTQNQSATPYFSTDKKIHDLIRDAIATGVYRWNILIDPGIGFVKRTSDNFSLIAQIPELKKLGYPVVFGASRKKFLQKLLDEAVVTQLAHAIGSSGAEARNQLLVPLNGLVHKIAAELGADVVRVHDVGAMVSIVHNVSRKGVVDE